MINERYLLKKKLGEGRSQVFLCVDSEFPSNEIAIKILPPDCNAEELATFKKEYFTLRKLNHPNIVRAIDFGTVVKKSEDNSSIQLGSKYFTLEYFEGCELLDFPDIEDENILTVAVIQLCSFLYYLHQSNYIYYDLKPENILISDDKKGLILKLIDLGFAQHAVDTDEDIIRGTAEYIAPEILRKEEHDHRVDLYSLGIILYRILYKKFPFQTNVEIEIYKSHVEKEFEFPEVENFSNLIAVTKKLLEKNPENRYQNVLEVLSDLEIPIDNNLTKHWLPAKAFTNRKDALTILKTYISDSKSGEVFSIKGFEGAGKTSLAEEIYSTYENVVFIGNNRSKTGWDFVKVLLNNLIYNDFVYPILTIEQIEKVEKFLSTPSNEFIDDLKSILNSFTAERQFILILDEFNYYDEFVLEVFKNLIPILQVNKIKVILTELSDYNYTSNFIFNLRDINLTSFTDSHLVEYLNKSYYKNFPKDELKKLILLYADLLPGSIVSFIKDITLLGIVKYENGKVSISADENEINILKSSHEEIYSVRLSSLTPEELRFARIISLFESLPDLSNFEKLMKLNHQDFSELVGNLQDKNILQQFSRAQSLIYVSESLRKFVYESIEDKEKLHLEIANALVDKDIKISRKELARHFQFANQDDKAFSIIKEEISEAEKISAYSYQKSLLDFLKNLSLSKDLMQEIKFMTCEVYSKLGDLKQAIVLADELLEVNNLDDKKNKLLDIKGRGLISTGKIEEGKKILTELIELNEDKSIKQALQLEIAVAEFDLNRYERTLEICNNIVKDEEAKHIHRGKAYNLMGLVSLYKNNDIDAALFNLRKAVDVYSLADQKLRVAQIEMNVGNLYSMKGENNVAEEYWNKSLKLNADIGNLDQEARLLINLGIFNFEKLNFEQALEYYRRAHEIFVSIGNVYEQALILYNLGEISLLTCQYQEAYDSLISSKRLSEQLQSNNEELEALYLLGKLFFTLGSREQLEKTIDEFSEKLELYNVVKKNKLKFDHLQALLTYSGDNKKKGIEEILELSDKFWEQEAKYDYLYSLLLVCDNLINNDQVEEAGMILNDEKIVEVCRENFLFTAERNFMLGKYYEKSETKDEVSSIDYYMKAYEAMEDLFITELTWKVLLTISYYYLNRGNYKKAGEYSKYFVGLINFIAENIKDSYLRKSYLNKSEIKIAFETLEL